MDSLTIQSKHVNLFLPESCRKSPEIVETRVFIREISKMILGKNKLSGDFFFENIFCCKLTPECLIEFIDFFYFVN